MLTPTNKLYLTFDLPLDDVKCLFKYKEKLKSLGILSIDLNNEVSVDIDKNLIDSQLKQQQQQQPQHHHQQQHSQQHQFQSQSSLIAGGGGGGGQSLSTNSLNSRQSHQTQHQVKRLKRTNTQQQQHHHQQNHEFTMPTPFLSDILNKETSPIDVGKGIDKMSDDYKQIYELKKSLEQSQTQQQPPPAPPTTTNDNSTNENDIKRRLCLQTIRSSINKRHKTTTTTTPTPTPATSITTTTDNSNLNSLINSIIDDESS